MKCISSGLETRKLFLIRVVHCFAQVWFCSRGLCSWCWRIVRRRVALTFAHDLAACTQHALTYLRSSVNHMQCICYLWVKCDFPRWVIPHMQAAGTCVTEISKGNIIMQLDSTCKLCSKNQQRKHHHATSFYLQAMSVHMTRRCNTSVVRCAVLMYPVYVEGASTWAATQ